MLIQSRARLALTLLAGGVSPPNAGGCRVVRAGHLLLVALLGCAGAVEDESDLYEVVGDESSVQADVSGPRSCDLGDIQLLLSDPIVVIGYSDSRADLERSDRRSASVNIAPEGSGVWQRATVVYHDVPYEYVAVVRPASAIEIVVLDSCTRHTIGHHVRP